MSRKVPETESGATPRLHSRRLGLDGSHDAHSGSRQRPRRFPGRGRPRRNRAQSRDRRRHLRVRGRLARPALPHARVGDADPDRAYSSDLRVRAAAIEIDLAVNKVAKTGARVEQLIEMGIAREEERPWVTWALGMLANRGVQPRRIHELAGSGEQLKAAVRTRTPWDNGADRNSLPCPELTMDIRIAASESNRVPAGPSAGWAHLYGTNRLLLIR